MRAIAIILTLSLLAVITQAGVRPQVPKKVNDGVNGYNFVIAKYGNKVIESYKGRTDEVQSCGKHGAPDGGQCLLFSLSPQDGDSDVRIDRARLEVNMKQNLGNKGTTWNNKWYFYITPGTVVINQFFHCHQLFSGGPVITYTLEGKYFTVMHMGVGSLAQGDVNKFIGRWIQADEYAHYDTNGWYQTKLTDASTGEVLLNVDRTNVNFMQKANQVHVKFGVYRHLGNWPKTTVAFNEWQMKQI